MACQDQTWMFERWTRYINLLIKGKGEINVEEAPLIDTLGISLKQVIPSGLPVKQSSTTNFADGDSWMSRGPRFTISRGQGSRFPLPKS